MSPNPETIEAARKMFAQKCDFVLSAPEPSSFPPSTLPEIAFIGRSNVGKSSLINALTNRKNLARASNTPGRTQQVVFFNLADRLMLVDLPGYGHAEAPGVEKDRWRDLVHTYLRARPALTCTCLLIDSRHGIMANDLEMMKFLDRAAASYKVVMTKIDQVRPIDRDTKPRQVAAKLTKHAAARDGIIITSSEKAIGLEDLRVFMMSLANPAV
jgi:GTP-binding protein